MICILKLRPDNAILGWLIANDMAEAYRQCLDIGEKALSREIYRRIYEPPPVPGKYELCLFQSTDEANWPRTNTDDQFILLVT